MGKKFLQFRILANVSQNFVRLLDAAQAESGKTDLDKSAVVENLVLHYLLVDDLLHVGLHHQVTSLSESVVDGQVINLLKGGSDALFGIAPLVNDLDQLNSKG